MTVEDAVILAAGEGRRMRPLTAYRPKGMMPVAGRPVLEHLIDRLAGVGVERVLVVVNYRAEAIRDRFGDGGDHGVRIEYVRQEGPRGTGDAARLAKGFAEGPFVLANGDVLVAPSDLEALVASGGPAMTVAPVPDVTGYGAVEVEDGRVQAIEEKPREGGAGLANAGVYLVDQGVFPALDGLEPSPRGELELTDAVRALAGEEGVAAVEAEEWIELSRPWDLLSASETLMADLETDLQGTVEDGVHVDGPVVVEEGARVRSGTYIEGPVIVGADADVGPNSYLRPSTVIGEDARVGNGCEVKNSLIMAGAHAAHLSYVGDSILGRHVNLGAGTQTANLRLDEGPVPVVTEKGRVDSGRRKLGAILGDNVKTGINATLDVGTVVGEDSYIGPGALVRGTHGPDSRIH